GPRKKIARDAWGRVADQDGMGQRRRTDQREAQMILRDYQQEAKQAVFQKLCDCKATLVEMATGLGKTVMFAHIANDWPGRVLVIAHRDELIRQAADKLQLITGKPVGIEMGRERADNYDSKVTVASIQTLARANRRHRYSADHFSLIIIDEGHHG